MPSIEIIRTQPRSEIAGVIDEIIQERWTLQEKERIKNHLIGLLSEMG